MTAIADLAELLSSLSPEQRALFQAMRRARRRDAAEPLVRRSWPDSSAPMSFGQERLWFLDQLTGGSPFYNSPFVLRLDGPLDCEALETAVAALVERHDVLRTTLDGAKQHVQGSQPTPFRHVDACGWSAEELARAVREESRRRVDLANGPMVQTTLLDLAPDEHLLVVALHHVVTDAWSADVCLREIGQDYECELGMRADRPARPDLQYRDFAAWQRESLVGERLEALLEHWRSRVGDAEQVIELPPDLTRRQIPRHLGAMYVHEAEQSLAADVHAFVAESAVTPFVALLVVHALVIADLTGRRDMLTVTPFSNRRPEVESLVGFFANQMPLRLRVDEEASYAELVQGAKAVVRDAQAGEELPYELLVRDLVHTRDVSRNPLVQIGYTHARIPAEVPTFGGLSARLLFPDIRTNRIDLYTGTAANDEKLFVTTWYDTDLYGERTLRAFSERFERTLATVLERPDAPLAKLELLGRRRRPRTRPATRETLTPIQRWFLEQRWPDPSHYNQAAFVTLREPASQQAVERALRAVVAHHDATRLRVEVDGERWSARVAATEPADLVWSADAGAFEAEAERAHRSFDLAGGPLVRAVLGDHAEEPQRLLIVAHHVVVDARSWQILLEDLGTAIRAVANGEEPCLPPATTSFVEYAAAVGRFGASPTVAAEKPFWQAQLGLMPLPLDRRGPNTIVSERTLEVELDATRTAALARSVPRFEAALLAALALAVSSWTDGARVAVHVERHGRDPVVDGVDSLRTVGWLAARLPLALPVMGTAAETVAAVRAVTDAIPNGGIGFGAARYAADAGELASAPLPDLSFNYLGHYSTAMTGSGLRLLPNPPGAPRSPSGLRPHAVALDAHVVDGVLKVAWTWSDSLHERKTIERVAERYRAALVDLATPKADQAGNRP